MIAIAAGEYYFAENETITVPEGVALIGAQKGRSAWEWAQDDSAAKTVLSRDSASATDTPILRLSAGAVADGLALENADYKAIMADDAANVQVRNCAVLGSANDAMDFDGCIDPVVENCYIENIVDCGIEFNDCESTGGAKIVGNEICGVADSQNGAIRICSTTGDVLVEGNRIRNMHSSEKDLSWSAALNTYAIVVDEMSCGGTITIRANILDTVDYGIAVYKYVSGTEQASFTVEDNQILNYAKAGITVSTLNYKAPSGSFTRGSVVGNYMDTQTAEALTVEVTNRWGEETTGWEVVCTGNTSGGMDIADETYSN